MFGTREPVVRVVIRRVRALGAQLEPLGLHPLVKVVMEEDVSLPVALGHLLPGLAIQKLVLIEETLRCEARGLEGSVGLHEHSEYWKLLFVDFPPV